MHSSKSQPEASRRLDYFSDYLRKKGLKFTNQRALVANQIFEIDSHFTADDLIENLKKVQDKISRATTYRIISVMVEAGLLAEHHFGQSAKFYEHVQAGEHHDHIICIDCGRIDEFYDKKIEDIQLQVAKKLGFTLANHSLNLYGTCQMLHKKGLCKHKKK